MLLALDTPQLVMMTIGFTGMLAFLAVALWLHKRQRAQSERLPQPRAQPIQIATAPKQSSEKPTPAIPATSQATTASAPPPPAPNTDAVAFEPTLFARAHVDEVDAPRRPEDRTEIVDPVFNTREVSTNDATEFVPPAGETPVERTQMLSR